MWPINLSVRLPIAGLVGRYLTNYLIGRESILKRINPLVAMSCGIATLCGISTDFSVLFPTRGQVPHALLTRPPLSFKESKLPFGSVRLACVKHAASVHPEPGSNSQKNFESHVWLNYFLIKLNSLELKKVRYYFKFLHSIQFSSSAPYDFACLLRQSA